jgi:uncharacterized protein (DUF2252 family)
MRGLLFGTTFFFACQGGISGTPDDGISLEGPTFGPERSAWVVSEIQSRNQNLSPEVRTEKFAALALSPFSFYRGTNHLYWADFAQSSLLFFYGDASTHTWLQGDLHTNNLGAFSNDQGQVVYDLNDFDEAVVYDYQLDVWRFATSIALLAKEANLSSKQTKTVIDAFSEAYLDAMADFRESDKELDVELLASNTSGPLDDFLKETASNNSRDKLLSKWTNKDNGVRSFDLSLDDLAAIDDDILTELRGVFAAYGETLSGGIVFDENFFAIKDAAKRLHAGVGSLGNARFYVLIEGPTTSPDDDIILDIKHQPKPTAYEFLPKDSQTLLDGFSSTAERAIIGQRALGHHTDDFAGWLSLSDGDYSVREVSPFKESLPTSSLNSASELESLASQWGLIIAAGHARADKDFSESLVGGSVDKAIDELTDGDHDGFRKLVRNIAISYAEQVSQDYQSFLKVMEN